MSVPLEIVCEVYGVGSVSYAQQKQMEDVLEEGAQRIFGQKVRGLWIHEGVFGAQHPRYVICPACDSPPGVPCRNLNIRSCFAVLRGGHYHQERRVASRNR